MEEQQKRLNQSELPFAVSLHCEGCGEKFHRELQDIIDVYRFNPEDKLDVRHPFICEGCAPAIFLLRGVFHSDNCHSYASFQQYDVRVINRKFKEGIALSGKLSVIECLRIIEDLKKDQANRMNHLLKYRMYNCECDFCCAFPDFTPLLNRSLDEISSVLKARRGCASTPPDCAFVRCNRMWAYYILFLDGPERFFTIPQRSRKVCLQSNQNAISFERNDFGNSNPTSATDGLNAMCVADKPTGGSLYNDLFNVNNVCKDVGTAGVDMTHNVLSESYRK